MAAALPARANPIERTKQRRLSTQMLHALAEELPRLSLELEALKRQRVPSEADGDTLGAGTFPGSPEATEALRNLSLLSQEELISEATDPVRRMCALVKSELMAGLMAEQAALGGKYHWAKQFMEHQRRCGDTLQKLRREAALKSKSLPADWDNLRRWLIYHLQKWPDALESFYQVMENFEEGRLRKFEGAGESRETPEDDTGGVGESESE